MADFDSYAPRLKKWEGGFVNDPADLGGATMCGVTLKTYKSIYGQDKTINDMFRMTQDEWRTIMKGEYWDRCRADYIRSQSVAEMLVDWCINSGKPAIKGIQRLISVDVDGIMGNITLAAINRAESADLWRRLKDARIQYYHSIVAARPANKKFLNGWLNRVNDFQYHD